MDGLLKRVGVLTSPRSLLGLSLMLSLVSASGGRGTLAYFTSSAASQSMTFSSGQIDITSSTLPTSAGISWNTSGGGTDCKTLQPETNANDTTAQAMVPGQFCVAKVTISNAATNAVDAWMRIRLVRDTTATDTTTTALNDRLRFYMSEYRGDSTLASNGTVRDANCTTTNFQPTSALTANVYTTADTTTTVTIADTTATGKSSSVIADGLISGSTYRYAFRSLGEVGKSVGQHPGMFAPADTTAGSYFNGGAVFDGTAAPTKLTPAAKGLGLVGGANNAAAE